MVYGNRYTTESCIDVIIPNSSNTTSCTVTNTTDFITEFERYDMTAYYLYRVTFGHELTEVNTDLNV
jgi:hypothetical protein